MRKRVRQAKVHVIRKLTREVKKLRDRKGSEEVQLKSKRKADRLYLEITTIKVFLYLIFIINNSMYVCVGET